jgi:hypothetical protein
MWSQFWHTQETAGPTLLDVAKVWDRTPRFLRKEPRSKPSSFQSWREPVRLTPAHADQVATFWKTWYHGSDWWLDATPDWVSTVLEDTQTLALGVFSVPGGPLVATILCRPVVSSGDYVVVGKETSIHKVYMIEGLCIHGEYRGQHLAGWLISWVDYKIGQSGPAAFFWTREVPYYTPTTDIAIHTYGYAHISELSISCEVRKRAWSEFRSWWKASYPSWRSDTRITVSLPAMSDKEAKWIEVWEAPDSHQILVLANTRRKTTNTNMPIYEVLWCGTKSQTDILFLASSDTNFRPLIESATKQTSENGIVFVSSAAHQGSASLTWPHPWKYGTSGYHSINLYNYMPPAFWTCDVQLVRNDI